MSQLQRVSNRIYFLVALILLAGLGVTIFLMGQPLICECGYVKLWHGDPVSAQNSKHIADWYTLSHIIHGIIFFWIIDWLAPDWPLGLKLIGAVIPEMAWEIFENTDMVIEYYRQNTVSVEYRGDSVLNSVADVGAMAVGFLLTFFVPWWVALLVIILLEAIALWFIRDGLFLNILMFIHPFDAITEWQSSG